MAGLSRHGRQYWVSPRSGRVLSRDYFLELTGISRGINRALSRELNAILWREAQELIAHLRQLRAHTRQLSASSAEHIARTQELLRAATRCHRESERLLQQTQALRSTDPHSDRT
jgi:hypothetical protein